ncbi:MAG: hypothetical protein OXG64_07245 [Chloroflexi bacterium]|nr:hypothetical protein [Chloroflexota bacterium]
MAVGRVLPRERVTTDMSLDLAASTTWPDPDPPLATILFAKHRGRTYPQAVAVAQQAQVYREQVEGTAVTHVATFERTAAQASAASQLLQLTVSLKGSAVFDGDGVLVPNKWTAGQVLDCYRKASLCADPTAYCHVVINDPFARRGAFGLRDHDDGHGDRWLLPCRLINAAYLAFDAQHPASATVLIEAAAVRNGSQWCPKFAATAFRAVVVGAEAAASLEDQSSR